MQDALIRSLPPSLGVGYGNWTTVLTANDPAALVDQGGVSSTMLQVVQAFMQASVGISVLPQVGQKTQGCILFNTTMPSAYVGPPLPAELFPVAQSGSYMEVKIDDDSEPKTCAFLKDDDPLHKSASNCDLQNTSNGGTLRRCLSQGAMVTCTVIPKAFATSGKFGCGYDTAGGLLPSGCDEDGPSCAQDVVLPALYAQLRSRYVAPTGVAPLAAQVLPWFTAAGGGTWFGGLDLTPSLAYQQNIQPNPDKAVTCEINTDESVALKFSQCSNPHYQALKSHVDAYYRNDGSVVVPPMSQLEWPVSRGTMVSGVILAYASTNRSLRQRFVDALFDDATVCGDSSLYHVCWKTPQHKIVSVNPWHLGEFNPFSVCDVEYLPTSQGSNEYVYSYCNADNRECPAFNSRAVPMRCNPLFRQFVDYPGVPSQVDNEYLSYNLCEHTIEEDSDGCMNDQGLLGGFDGLPVGASSVSENMLVGTKYKNQPYSVASDLYTASSWAIPSDFADSGIYGVNPLWQGKEGPYGFVRAKDTDIGGHRVGLLVNRSETTGISTMTVWRLPLGEDEDGRLMLSSFTGRPASEWVQGLNASMLSDHEANMLLYGVAQAAQSGLPPSCPLQRWAFYSGSFRTFSPVLPSPKRARHLFRRVHGGAILAHPTMTKTDQGEGLGLYTTHNGFCACPVVQGVRQTQCLVSVATNMRCSLAETIASLQSGAWYESYVFAPVDVHRSYRRCTMQLDWPDIGNPLRDGSTSFKGSWAGASDLISRRCHVLDRLQPFRYRCSLSLSFAF